jgi:large subunit ribosomal protein L6
MVKIAFFKEELEIPKGITVNLVEGQKIRVKGPNGDITKDFSHVRGIKVSIENNKIIFSTNFPKGQTLALIKTVVSIINNLIKGIQNNYTYILKVCYSHFPCQVEAKPEKKEIHIINFLGERAPRVTKIEENVKVMVKGDDVILEGPDKETLGQTAANLRKCCKIRKKDPRVFQDGIYLYKTIHGEEILWEIK